MPRFATGDDGSLWIGQGATGLGPRRAHPQGVFIPRNAPPHFNLFAPNGLFWDGRVSVDAHHTFHTPAVAQLTKTEEQLQAAKQFLTLRCSICHNGATFSDGKIHNVALAQFGPGEGDGPSARDDFGRMRVTGNPDDRYRFRTTPLRNVEITGPYGHAGQFASLRAFIYHHSESDVKLRNYDPSQLEPLLRGTVLHDADAILATRDTILSGVVIPPEVVDQLTTYMRSLTDNAARNLRRVVPQRVPSGLPVDR